MGFFSRLATFFRIRANAALDKAENPGQVMDYSYSKQLEQLQNLKRSIADVVTNEKRLEMQQSQIQQQCDRLDLQAMRAIQANREDLAAVDEADHAIIAEPVAALEREFEQAAAAEAVRHLLFGEIDLAQVLGLLRPVRTKPNPGRDCRSPVSLATVLDGHLYPLSLGR